MPMGPAPLGFAYFVGVKFAGYTAAAWGLRKLYPDYKGGIVKVGAARTGIGMAAGLAYGALWLFLGTKESTPLYLIALIPIRIAEWLLLLHLFFDERLKDRGRAIKGSVAGTAWSYCLDAIGIGAALVIPGGIWVC